MPEFKKNRVKILNEESMLRVWVHDIQRYEERVATLNKLKKMFKEDLEHMMEEEGADAICLGDDEFWGSYNNASKTVVDKEAVLKAHPHLAKKAEEIAQQTIDFNVAVEEAAEADKKKFYTEQAGSSQFRALKAISIEGMTISKKKPLEKLLSNSVLVE